MLCNRDMTRWGVGLVLLVALCGWEATAQAFCTIVTTPPSYIVGQTKDISCDPAGSTNINKPSTDAGEDVTTDVQKVEQRFAYLNVTADVLVKTGAGFLHTMTCSSDAAATAGTIIVYDNTAESGTIIWTWTVNAVEYQPRTLIFDVAFATGLYVGYTTTADVTCTVSYR